MLDLTSPRHTPTLPTPAVRCAQSAVVLRRHSGRVKSTLTPLSDEWLGPAYFDSIAFDR